jgi:alpha-tubulin suppressor-like RCC1 family protein
LVASLTNVTALEAGGRHTCAISMLAGGSSSARSLYCWGEGSAGELGSGTTDRSTPVLTTTP